MANNTFNINRFILKNVAARVIGSVIPPYWGAVNEPVGEMPSNYAQGAQTGINNNAHYQLEQMTDEQLVEQIKTNALGVPMVLPVSIGLEHNKDNAWLLPIEPLITLSGRNIIIRRNVAKANPERQRRGTVKERWAQDDYSIRIEGVFINTENPNRYPEKDVSRLRELCEARESLYIENNLLQIFNIDRIAIETFELPFTKGTNNQAYVINAYSDDIFSLLVDDRGLQ